MDQNKLGAEYQNKVVDTNIVAFFDLLAKFDFEDKQKEVLVNNSTSQELAPSSEVLLFTNNSNDKPAVRASGKTCSAK